MGRQSLSVVEGQSKLSAKKSVLRLVHHSFMRRWKLEKRRNALNSRTAVVGFFISVELKLTIN